MMTITTNLKKLALFAVSFALANLALWWFFGNIVTIQTLKANYEFCKLFVANHYALSVLLYILSYTIDATFFLPITIVLLLAGGLLFGVLPTIFYAVIGASTGSFLGFTASRYFFGTSVQAKYQEKLADFNEHVQNRGILYIALLRLIPVIPFSLVNILAGMSLLTAKRFISATVLGMVPGACMYAYLGSFLATIDTYSDIFSAQVIVPFLAFKAIVILLMIAFEASTSKTASTSAS